MLFTLRKISHLVSCTYQLNILWFVLLLLQRVYDEDVEETVTKTDALEKQHEQVQYI